MPQPGQPIHDALANFADLLASARTGSDGQGVMLVVAHPDDETIGIGGHLRLLPNALVVHVTDGAPRDLRDARAHGFDSWQDYAQARRRELQAAMAEAGIAPQRLIALNLPDQQAARHLSQLARRLAELFRQHGVRFVLTHPYEGGHPDHDATAFAVHAACRLITGEGRTPSDVVEMAFYHAGPQGAVFQEFAADSPVPEIEIRLSAEDLGLKRTMLDRHATQRLTLAPFTSAVELFRAVPAYDFRQLPNGGRLRYETMPFGLDGSQWLDLARAALHELGLEDAWR